MVSVVSCCRRDGPHDSSYCLHSTEKKLTEKQSILFETKAGLRKVELELKDREIVGAEVIIGAVNIGEVLDIDVKGKTYTGVAAEAGNLHFVIHSFYRSVFQNLILLKISFLFRLISVISCI